MLHASITVTTPSGLIIGEGVVDRAAAHIATREGLRLSVEPPDSAFARKDGLVVCATWDDKSGAERYAQRFTIPHALRCEPRRLPAGLLAHLHVNVVSSPSASAQTT